MAAAWYIEWCEKHAKTFALMDEAFLETMRSWEELFAAAGYARADLDAATAALATGGKPLQRWDHLAAVVAFVRGRKAVVRVEEVPPGDDRGTCTTCGGSGFVSVPHPGGVVGGEWVPQQIARGGATYYTAAVYCSCGLGAWFRSRREKVKHQTWRLQEYEAFNPRWRVQVAARRREAEEWGRLTAPQPGELGATLDRLAEQYGLKALPPR